MKEIQIKEIIVPFIYIALLLPALSHSGNESISAAWQARAKVATKNLLKHDLDACDIALEKAFQNAQESNRGGIRTFDLNIQIGKQTMKAAYSYKNNTLNDFLFIKLPSRWMAHQKPDSKTFSVLVVDSNCALDLCTNDPFSLGPCKVK